MRTKRKVAVAAFVVCLVLVFVWVSVGPGLTVRGQFTKQDISELARLGKAENRRVIKADWSRSRGDIRQMMRVLRRFVSERVVRIERTPDNKAVVTIDRSKTSGRDMGYLFVSAKPGWKLAPPEFE